MSNLDQKKSSSVVPVLAVGGIVAGVLAVNGLGSGCEEEKRDLYNTIGDCAAAHGGVNACDILTAKEANQPNSVWAGPARKVNVCSSSSGTHYYGGRTAFGNDWERSSNRSIGQHTVNRGGFGRSGFFGSHGG
jgi:uncharacterized protein YgiB involved in biofilm formation